MDTWTLTTTFESWNIIDQWQLDEKNCYSHVTLGCGTILGMVHGVHGSYWRSGNNVEGNRIKSQPIKF